MRRWGRAREEATGNSRLGTGPVQERVADCPAGRASRRYDREAPLPDDVLQGLGSWTTQHDSSPQANAHPTLALV